jgi:DNA replication protein DnaC
MLHKRRIFQCLFFGGLTAGTGFNDLYNKATFILTSNKGPSKWGKFLGDLTLTTAILDRLLHRSEILTFNKEADRI